MLTKSQRKTKSYSIAAIMDNAKLSQLFGDALGSPLGSTKREKARSVLKSLTGIQGGYFNDGQGGIGYPDELTVTDQPYSPYAGINVTGQPAPKDAQLQSQGVPMTTYGPNQGMPPVSTSAGVPFIFQSAPTVKPDSEKTSASDMLDGFGATADGSTDPSSGTGYDITQFEEYEVPESLKNQYPSLFEAVDSGIGAKTFAQQIMNDKEKLKEFLPGVPEEELPIGSSLVQQIDELSDRLKEEHNIDQLKTTASQLEDDGMTIEKNLTNYMTARDEYITKVDGMIESAKDSTLKMDLANPHIAKMANQYLEYLYVLKGRQQKRYSDFLSDSITYHNNKMTRAQNAYNDASTKFNEEFTAKGKLTEERYNTLSSMLEDMYANVANREAEFYNIGTAREEYLQAQLETAETALDPLGLNDKIEWSQWAYNAGLNGRTESQANDIRELDSPPSWFREELENEARSSYKYVPLDKLEEGAMEIYKAGGVSELGKYMSGLKQFIEPLPVSDAEILEKWNEVKKKLQGSLSKVDAASWTRNFLASNLGRRGSDGTLFENNPSKIFNTIREETNYELSVSDITSIMTEFGFHKNSSWAVDPWSYYGNLTPVQKEEKTAEAEKSKEAVLEDILNAL